MSDASSLKDFVKEFTGKRMAERLENKKFASFADFDEALIESYVLSVIEKPDGSGNTRLIMQTFADRIGTGKSGTDKRYAYVSNKNWNSYEDLKKAFDGYTDPTNPGGSGGSDGSSGSGGSGGSGGSSSAASRIPSIEITPETSEDKTKAYPLSIFNDLETVAWAEDAIIALTEKGIINGVGNDMFAPDANITREEFTAMLERAFLFDADAVEIAFTDVVNGSWYFNSVSKAYGAGIVNGESESIFGTGKNITRQDMAVMLYRVGKYIQMNISAPDAYEEFADDADISGYAKDAVYALRAVKIINGVSGSEFAPLSNATRAQAAKMIYGLIEL